MAAAGSRDVKSAHVDKTCHRCHEVGHIARFCDRYRVEMCWHGVKCTHGACVFAHSKKELRAMCDHCGVCHAGTGDCDVCGCHGHDATEDVPCPNRYCSYCDTFDHWECASETFVEDTPCPNRYCSYCDTFDHWESECVWCHNCQTNDHWTDDCTWCNVCGTDEHKHADCPVLKRRALCDCGGHGCGTCPYDAGKYRSAPPMFK